MTPAPRFYFVRALSRNTGKIFTAAQEVATKAFFLSIEGAGELTERTLNEAREDGEEIIYHPKTGERMVRLDWLEEGKEPDPREKILRAMLEHAFSPESLARTPKQENQ